MKKMAAVLCAAALMLSACGNSDDEKAKANSDDAKAKANIKSAVLDDQTNMTGTTKPTEKQADCIADGMVDDVGVDTLQKYGLLDDDLKIDDKADPTNMSPDDADALAGVFVDCIDVQQMFASQFGSGTDKLPAAQQKCITDAIDEDAMKSGLSASFQGKEDEGFAAMQKKMTDCVMGSLGGQG
jgi:hypothetical protein